MELQERTLWICNQALTAGFDLCGVVPAQAYPDLGRLPEWLNRGYAGEMNYLNDPRRRDPRMVLEEARSLIVVALNYNTANHSRQDENAPGPHGWISRYAWGDDYHEVLKEKLETLIRGMRAEFGESFTARSYVDTGPILERVVAKYAGLGWLAKNTCLINQRLGSWLFLGVIITTLELEPTLNAGVAPAADLCGKCTRCLDACPTQAFPEPYVLDARKCISYLTIELRGSIPNEARAAMGDAVIGCDICQDVCPWNRKAPVTAVSAFEPRVVTVLDGTKKSLFRPPLQWLASLSQEEFSKSFRKSAAKRAKWRGVVRNACVALGNSRMKEGSEEHQRATAVLEKLAASEDDLISEHARWALERLNAKETDSPERA
jgi:epoxyqueuosine reductase